MNAGQYPGLEYYEQQHFAAWVYVVLVAVILGSFAPFWGIDFPEQHGVLIAAGILQASFWVLRLRSTFFACTLKYATIPFTSTSVFSFP